MEFARWQLRRAKGAKKNKTPRVRPFPPSVVICKNSQNHSLCKLHVVWKYVLYFISVYLNWLFTFLLIFCDNNLIYIHVFLTTRLLWVSMSCYMQTIYLFSHTNVGLIVRWSPSNSYTWKSQVCSDISVRTPKFQSDIHQYLHV